MDTTRDEIFRLLSDPTRLGIFKEIIGGGGRTVTSSDIAVSFNLHPNVARMHLQKLAGAGLLASGGLSSSSSTTRLLASLEGFVREQGLFPQFSKPSRQKLEVHVFNCVFKELSTQHADLTCRIHQQLFIGLCQSHFPKIKVASLPEIAGGGASCLFSLELPTGYR